MVRDWWRGSLTGDIGSRVVWISWHWNQPCHLKECLSSQHLCNEKITPHCWITVEHNARLWKAPKTHIFSRIHRKETKSNVQFLPLPDSQQDNSFFALADGLAHIPWARQICSHVNKVFWFKTLIDGQVCNNMNAYIEFAFHINAFGVQSVHLSRIWTHDQRQP